MKLTKSCAASSRGWRRTAMILAAIGALAVAPLRADESSSLLHHYLVEIPAADEPSEIATELAGTYLGRLEIYAAADFHGFAIAMSPERAALLRRDPHVSRVTERAHPAIHSNTDPAVPDVGPFSYDGAGNITQIGTDRYLYDSMSRLVHGTANTPGHDNAQQFEYDAFGNLLTVTTTNAPTLHIGIDPATNHLVNSAMQSDGTFIWGGEYDDAGNQKKLSGDAYHYDYDPLNMMVCLTPQLGTPKLYLYDASDERVATVDYASATTTTWHYTLRDLSGKVLRTLDENISPSATNWNWTRDYVFRDGSMLAAYAPAGSTDETITHYHLDHLGSPVRITNDAHQQIALHKYWPYGGDAPGSTPDSEVLKFTGHERDADGTVSALDYMHARYYGSLMGRFVSVDPMMDVSSAVANPQAWNRYAYVKNNPVVYVDSDGKQTAPGQVYVDGHGWTNRSVLDPANEATPEMALEFGAVTASLLPIPGEGLAAGLLGKAFTGVAERIEAAIGGGLLELGANRVGHWFEGIIAKGLGAEVKAFDKTVLDAAGKRIGEIDIETSKHIIEVTLDSTGKTKQAGKLVGNALMNPEGKQVIVYGPNITKVAQESIEKTGAKVIRDFDQLQKVVRQ